MNMRYDLLEPVAINPKESHQYFILTHTKARTWAQAQVSDLFLFILIRLASFHVDTCEELFQNIAGVNLMSPPPSLKYNLVCAPDCAAAEVKASRSGLNVKELILGVINGLEE